MKNRIDDKALDLIYKFVVSINPDINLQTLNDIFYQKKIIYLNIDIFI